jgi:hypothetical protein
MLAVPADPPLLAGKVLTLSHSYRRLILTLALNSVKKKRKDRDWRYVIAIQPRGTPLYQQKLALTSPTSGCRLVGIACLQTQATEFLFNPIPR